MDKVTFVMKTLGRNSVFNVPQTIRHGLTVANMDLDIQLHFQLFWLIFQQIVPVGRLSDS